MQITISFEADTLDEAMAKARAAVLPAEDRGCLILGQIPFDSVGCLRSIDAKPSAVPNDSVSDLFVAPVPTPAEALAALRDLYARKGEPASRKLLADFGADKVGDVPAEQRAAFIAAAEKVMS